MQILTIVPLFYRSLTLGYKVHQTSLITRMLASPDFKMSTSAQTRKDQADQNERTRKIMQAGVDAYASGMPRTNFDNAHAKTVSVLSCTMDNPGGSNLPGATFGFTVPDGYANSPAGTTHGAAITLFFDGCTTVAMLASTRYWGSTGVSRTMNVSFVRSPKTGDKVILEAEVVQMGQIVCTLRGVLRRADGDKEVLALCTHEKVRVGEAKRTGVQGRTSRLT